MALLNKTSSIISSLPIIEEDEEAINLLKFINYWFQHEEHWFPKTSEEKEHSDKIINKMVNRYFDDDWISFISNTINKFSTSGEGINNKKYLAYTLLLDQCNRHMYRDTSDPEILGKRISNDNMARKLCISKLFSYGNFDTHLATQFLAQNFKPEEIVFLLLPLRHGLHKDDFFIKLAFKIISNLIKQDLETTTTINSYYKRFYRATFQQLAEFNSTIIDEKYPLKTIIVNNNINQTRPLELISRQEITQILDLKCQYNIPQHYWNLFDKATKLTKYQTQFWKTNFIQPINQFLSTTLMKTLVISVSGGVDSMVLLTSVMECFRQMKNANKSSNIEKVNVVHINYMNRDTSSQEANMVHQFINFLNEDHILPITYYQRNISEVSRSDCPFRDIYEQVTRNIRFKMYSTTSNSDKTVVSLGHNKDDCQENIWNNMMKQQSYQNLKGMLPVSYEKGVQIWRPFLSVSKLQIYQMANILELPYLYDSTPDWSERGKKRDILFPFLDKFDSRITSGMENLAETFQEMYSIYETLAKNSIEWDGTRFQVKIQTSILQYPCQLFKECLFQSIGLIQENTGIHFAITNRCITSTFQNLKTSSQPMMKFNLKTNADTGKCLTLIFKNGETSKMVLKIN